MTPTTRKQVAILGTPVARALSPVIHRAAYQALGMDWSYHAIECTEQQLPAFLSSLGEEWAGLSLTRPLKTAATQLVHELSAVAKIIGSINTITVRQGRLYGENTDIHGMVAALAEVGTTHAHTAAIVGSGGTAASALAALSAMRVPKVSLVARNLKAACRFLPVADALEIHLNVLPWSVAKAIRDHEIVIFAVPPKAADPLAQHMVNYEGTVLDVVYGAQPTLVSRVAARSPDCRVAQGLSMLIYQASKQFGLQTRMGDAPIDVMRAAAEAVLAANRTLATSADRSRRYAKRSVPAVSGGSP